MLLTAQLKQSYDLLDSAIDVLKDAHDVAELRRLPRLTTRGAPTKWVSTLHYVSSRATSRGNHAAALACLYVETSLLVLLSEFIQLAGTRESAANDDANEVLQ